MKQGLEQLLTWFKKNIFNTDIWTIRALNDKNGDIWVIPVFIAFMEAITLGMFVIYYLFYESN